LNNIDVHHRLFEQNALQILIEGSKEISSAILVEADQKKFNSFPIERNLFHATRTHQVWSHGDFICHFSGIRTPHLERYIADYAKALRWNPAGCTVTPLPAP
jgi:REP element-mobilizing transposase RayT